MTTADLTVWHVGRSWGGPADLETGCPCPKAGCGLVVQATARPDCVQHGPTYTRTMRTIHPADQCPGVVS